MHEATHAAFYDFHLRGARVGWRERAAPSLVRWWFRRSMSYGRTEGFCYFRAFGGTNARLLGRLTVVQQQSFTEAVYQWDEPRRRAETQVRCTLPTQRG